MIILTINESVQCVHLMIFNHWSHREMYNHTFPQPPRTLLFNIQNTNYLLYPSDKQKWFWTSILSEHAVKDPEGKRLYCLVPLKLQGVVEMFVLWLTFSVIIKAQLLYYLNNKYLDILDGMWKLTITSQKCSWKYN